MHCKIPPLAETCLAGVSDYMELNACIGLSAERCMEETDGGYSTVGMGGCLDREWEYWDARLNIAYGKAMRAAEAMDAEMADLGASVPSQADALRAMQRAWIPFRDRKCDFARSQWGGGTGGGPASISCLMVTTAQQALYIEGSALGE